MCPTPRTVASMCPPARSGPAATVRRSFARSSDILKRQPHVYAPRGTPELPGTLPFLRLLWEINHGLESASKHMARHLGVTGPQRFVIRLIGQFPGISAGDLAALLHSDPSTLTGVLRRLESRGLLIRARDSFDARRVLFRLTPRGHRINQISAGTIEDAVRVALRHVGAKDVTSGSKLLRRIASQLFAMASTRGSSPRASGRRVRLARPAQKR